MREKWVVVTPAAPIEGDFGGTHGQGSPLVISKLDDTGYYNKDGVITALAGGSGGGSTIIIDGGDASNTGTPYMSLDGGSA